MKSSDFPSATCVGASFDKSLAFQVGKEIAKEAYSKSANVLLAPTVNLNHSPLSGSILDPQTSRNLNRLASSYRCDRPMKIRS